MAKPDTIRESYERAVETLFSDREAFAEYLKFSGRFYKLPSSQTITLFYDNPNAQMVADYETWQRFGRSVKPNGWATAVISNGQTKRLFDISMTRGEKVPYQWRLEKYSAEKYMEQLSERVPQPFTNMSGAVNYLSENGVNNSIGAVLNELSIPEDRKGDFKRSFYTMVRTVVAARCEWNSDFVYANGGLDLSYVDMLRSSDEFETLLEYVQMTSKEILLSMENSINKIIYERSISNGRTEGINRTGDNRAERTGTQGVVRGAETISAVGESAGNSRDEETVSAEREDVRVRADNGNGTDRSGTRTDDAADKPLGTGVAAVYDGELPGGHSETSRQTALGTDTAQDRPGSVGDLGENAGELSTDKSSPDFGERDSMGGEAESPDRGTDNGLSGERAQDGSVNEHNETAEELPSAVSDDLNKFYVDRERGEICMVYYNPDSEAGGSLVYNYFSFDELENALSSENPFDSLVSACRTEWLDKGASVFEESLREFKTGKADYESRGNVLPNGLSQLIAERKEAVRQDGEQPKKPTVENAEQTVRAEKEITAEELSARLVGLAKEISEKQAAATELFSKQEFSEAAELAREVSELARAASELKAEIQSREIRAEDVEVLRSITPKRKSVQNMLENEVAQTPKFEKLLSEEMGAKSPYEMRNSDNSWRTDETKTVPVIEVEKRELPKKIVELGKGDNLANFTRGMFVNDDTDIEITFGKAAIKETITKAVHDQNRGISVDARINALYHIPELIKNAVRFDSQISEPGAISKSPNTLFLHRMYGVYRYDGELYLANLAVEELYSKSIEAEIDKTSNRLYNLRDIKIAPMKLPGLNPGAHLQNVNEDTSIGATISIAQLYDFVKTYDKSYFENPNAVGRADREAEIEAQEKYRDTVKALDDMNAVEQFKSKTAEHFAPIGGLNADDIEADVRSYVQNLLDENEINAQIVDLAIVGSRSRNLGEEQSDLDVAIEFTSDLKEDALFNILHEEPYEIGGVTVDINPIRKEETGTLGEYLKQAERTIAENHERKQQSAMGITERIYEDGTSLDLSEEEPVQSAEFSVHEPEYEQQSVFDMDAELEQDEPVKLKDLVIDLIPRSEREEQRIDPPVEKHNFTITDEHLGEGGQKAKYAANIAAIQTLKAVESENRLATPAEQEVLSKYVGWGGIPKAFDGDDSAWASEYAQLKELLSPDEYEAARSTVLNAHFTSPTIISAVYSALENFGFKGGNILEPSMGIGNFFGVMPEEMRSQSHLHGVELDDISGRIAKQLYPNADIQICGYEHTALSDNFFDVAVGNVPFGNYGVSDARYDREHFLIHDYFFAKTLDKVAPNGIVAFITSKGTLDKASPKVREYLAKRADLIGAVRLPNNAFKQNAGTEVTADIIFLQKREKMAVEKPNWCYTSEISDGISVNQYFADHPEMILGEMKLVSGRYGEEAACVPIEGADLKEQLSVAVSRLKRDIITSKCYLKRDEEHGIIPATADVRNYTFEEVDGKIYFRENNIMRETPLKGETRARMHGLIGVRNTFRKLVDAQSEGCSDETLAELQLKLNTEYDAFVARFGHISDIENRKIFGVDDDCNMLCGALELINPETKTVTKADIFTTRTIKPYVEVTHVDTPQEALYVSLDMRGEVDIDYMSELCGISKDEVINDLLSDSLIYKNPQTAKYEETAEYLSGYVCDKLRKAQDAAAENPEYERNVAALEKVLPPKLGAGDISVRLGAPWIEIADYCKFFREYAQGVLSDQSWRGNDSVLYRTLSGEYKINNKNSDRSVASQSSFGTSRMNSYSIFENLLNNRDVTVYDTFDLPDGKKKRVMNKDETQLAQEKARQMREAFPKWLWSDPERREKYVDVYNELFNSLVGREYDGSHQTFPGMNPFIELTDHQKNAVMRAKVGGNTLLAHCVGAGKTFEMAAAVMEKRRLGLINKACIVVPKHLVGQMSAEWQRLYPEARLLTAKENDFNEVNRQKFFGRCCTGDYDAVIMSYQQFQKIPMSVEYQRDFLTKQLQALTEHLAEYQGQYLRADEKRSVKDIERMKKTVETKLQRLIDTPRDNSLSFEQLGFDCIVADEAHNYKNGLIVTKMKNVSGIGSKAAKKCEDFLMKTQYLNEKYGERNLILSTGTPVSNSMTELYTMQQYLRPSALQRQGLQNFDDWSSTFGEVVSQLELKPAGDGFRMKKRFAKFNNLPELMQAYKDFADIRTAEMLNLPVPEVEGGKPQVISAKPNEFQKAYMQVLAARSEAIHNGSVDPSVDNMLKITNEARLLGLDARCLNPDADNYPNSKVNLLISKVMEIYTDTTAEKGVQAIFCDIAINGDKKSANEIAANSDEAPDDDGEKTLSAEQQAELLGASKFSVYDYIKQELIRRGVPENEICFAGDAKNIGQRNELYSQLRAGTKRIVIASTSKMGTGANVQTRLCALHNLDIPWKPSDFEQRIGRIVRQGNSFSKVKLFNYVTEGTFDAYMLNLIVTKQKFISQLMSGKTPARTCEDVDELVLNYSEMQAIASGDPRIKEKIRLDTDVSRLRLLENEHLNKKYMLEDKAAFCQAHISIAKKQLALAHEDENFAKKNALPEGEFKIELNGKIFTERKEAGAELRKAQMSFLSTKKATEIGEYRGFSITLNWTPVGIEQHAVSATLTRKDERGLSYLTELELQNDLGNITRLENVLKLGIDRQISNLQASLERNEKDLAEALRTKDAPFEYADELQEKSLRLAQLDAELGVGNKDEVIIDEDNQAENLDKGKENGSPDKKIKPKSPKH